MIAAFGKNRTIDDEFFRLIQEKLKAFLKSYGEDPVEFEAMPIVIEEVNFEGWASDQADFLKKSLHGDTELAIAFFPSTDTQVKIGESVSKKMLALEIDEIRADQSVDFDAYIYMPTNNRYLLYPSSSGVLYSNQAERLKQSGIKSLHVRKEDLGLVKRHKTQNFLNDQIEKFRASQKSAMAA